MTIALGVAVALLYWARLFFITFFSAVAIAFILEPFVTLLMRVRFPRNLASFVVCTIALLIVYLLGLGAYAQVSDLLDNVPRYSQRIETLAEETRARIEGIEKRTYELVLPSRRRQVPQPAPEVTQKTRRKRAAPEPVVPAGPPPTGGGGRLRTGEGPPVRTAPPAGKEAGAAQDRTESRAPAPDP